MEIKSHSGVCQLSLRRTLMTFFMNFNYFYHKICLREAIIVGSRCFVNQNLYCFFPVWNKKIWSNILRLSWEFAREQIFWMKIFSRYLFYMNDFFMLIYHEDEKPKYQHNYAVIQYCESICSVFFFIFFTFCIFPGYSKYRQQMY